MEIEIPKQLQRNGFRFVLLRKKGKEPIMRGWQEDANVPYDNIMLKNHIKNGGNYGVLCGKENLAVIDVENYSEELKIKIERELPKTLTIKTGSGGFHYYYIIEDLEKKIIMIDDNEKHWGEVQFTGSQVVGAGSIHPNGNEYKQINNELIARIDKKTLLECIKPFCKTGQSFEKYQIEDKEIEPLIKEMIKHWIKGDRQNLALSLSGYLRKEKRFGIKKAKLIIGEICKRTKDKEISMRLKAVEETFKKDEKEIRGISGLEFLQEEKKEYSKKKLKENYENKLQKTIFAYESKKELANQILDIQPMYYDKSRIWWFWDIYELKWRIADEVDILNFVSSVTRVNTIDSKEKNEILEALRQESRKKRPKEIKDTWIQFNETIIDIATGEEIKASPEFFVTNPIPYSLHKKKFIETPNMDKIFKEWVGKDYVRTLYEIIAYSLLPSYPLNRIFCFLGSGMNGKSKFLELLRKFIGKDNVCSTELDTLLNSRFEVTRLHKKLVCQMGETNFNEMNKTSILKKLSGGDLIGFEYKRKDPFEDKNYAKIIIATNNLPTTTDKTVGFYRRWLLIDFPNQFSEKKDILKDIPEEEYESLAVKCTIILKDLLDKRMFHNEGDIETRTKRYEEKSNPLSKFWKENIKEDSEGYIFKFDLRKKLDDFCRSNNFRILTDREIKIIMKEKDIVEQRRLADWHTQEGKKLQLRCWVGISWKN